ncbi:MAG: DUF3352 domain-containing protein [Chloroflexi bacterium]|nr:DUF3352 domain-containing protein [Chloroflexota bacterium]
MTDPGQGHDPTIDPAADTTAAPIPTMQVSSRPAMSPVPNTTGAKPRRAGRARWAIAGGVIAAVVAVSALATVVLTGAAPAATVVGYVPANSVMYGEVRLDLPGDQRQHVGAFLSKFPGFADQAALDTKLDEMLDRIVGEASENEETFSRDIKPWFDGEVAFALGPLPDAGTTEAPAAMAAATRAIVLISIKDEALARSWFTSVLDKTGASGTAQTYGGTDLTVFSDASMPGAQAAYGILGGKVAVAGDLASVKAAIDTKGASGLSQAPNFAAATAASSDDHIGFVYFDLRSILDRAMDFADSSAGGMSTPPMSQAMLAMIPDWMAFRLRVEADALVMDATTPDVPTAPGPKTNHANGVAGFAPPSTIVLAAGNEIGQTLLDSVALYRSEPSFQETIESIEQAAGFLGGLEASLSWMGDTGVVVARAGDSLEGGLVSVPLNADQARQLLTQIRSFVTLAGAQQGITVREEAYAETTITIVDLGSVEDVAGLAGALSGGAAPVLPGDGLPSGQVEIAYAATDGVVVIGSGPAFVKHVLDAGSGASLADDARFQGLLSRVGSEHTGLSFIDLAAVRTMAEGLLSQATADERAEYEKSIKPFLAPFDALIGATVNGSDLDQQHSVITIK